VAIAFFDFDRTLIAANSGPLWIRTERKLGHLTRWQTLRAATWLAAYTIGFAGLDEAVERAIATLAGTRERDFRERTEAFYRSQLSSLYRPGARRALEEHRSRQDSLVLLTSSSVYLSELVAAELKLDAVLCTRFEVNPEGVYTGRISGILCFGEGKRVQAESFARQANVGLGECAFYTDSYADLPVLKAVGRPVAVNPDRRLRREATRRGWEVVDWGRPN
jgi:HAD superfamily hydrolase (TIGR01490 family)